MKKRGITSIKAWILTLLLSLAFSGCVNHEPRIRALEIEIEKVNNQTKAIEIAHPEVEETLIGRARLLKEKALLQFIVDSRNKAMEKLSDLPSGTGAVTVRFEP